MRKLDRPHCIPLPAVTEVDRLPTWVFGDDPMLPALVPAMRLDARQLRRLRELMGKDGEELQVHRMRYDRRYAAARIGLALDSPDRQLRRLALTLLDHYTRESAR